MHLVIWSGAAISALGLVGIVWSLLAVMRARRTLTDDEALRARMTRILPVNLGAFLLSFLGLMVVVVGVILR
ncbi:MAG: hypothetical protein GC146_04725 [Limimaricola sp.]|uniref:hypothetical protein n=1 Tax=Limimaricola sp. TaxID=2211665 RepID=UPI001DDBA2D2|nr:hypothetical protein [Limimaricola sp.]MBI1416509.1 hypothetical protein [Limimaricola sp.]